MADFSKSPPGLIEAARWRHGFRDLEDLSPLRGILALGAGREGGASLRLGDRSGIWFEAVQGDLAGPGVDRALSLEGSDLEGQLRLVGSGAEGRLEALAATILEILRLRRLGSERRRQPRGPEGASFIPGVVHELRNFLFAMGAGLDAFEIRFGEREAEANHAASLRRNLARLQDFMEELETYGNPAALTFARGPLRPVLAQGARLAEPLAGNRKVRLILGEAPEVVERMDRGALEAAIRHLLEAAILETSEGGEVALGGRVLEGPGRPWVEVSVSGAPGRGRDLDPDRLFEPFHYRDKALPRLGLAIARRTLEAHGGQVSAALESGSLRLRALLPVWFPELGEGNP